MKKQDVVFMISRKELLAFYLVCNIKTVPSLRRKVGREGKKKNNQKNHKMMPEEEPM